MAWHKPSWNKQPKTPSPAPEEPTAGPQPHLALATWWLFKDAADVHQLNKDKTFPSMSARAAAAKVEAGTPHEITKLDKKKGPEGLFLNLDVIATAEEPFGGVAQVTEEQQASHPILALGTTPVTDEMAKAVKEGKKLDPHDHPWTWDLKRLRERAPSANIIGRVVDKDKAQAAGIDTEKLTVSSLQRLYEDHEVWHTENIEVHLVKQGAETEKTTTDKTGKFEFLKVPTGTKGRLEAEHDKKTYSQAYPVAEEDGHFTLQQDTMAIIIIEGEKNTPPKPHAPTTLGSRTRTEELRALAQQVRIADLEGKPPSTHTQASAEFDKAQLANLARAATTDLLKTIYRHDRNHPELNLKDYADRLIAGRLVLAAIGSFNSDYEEKVTGKKQLADFKKAQAEYQQKMRSTKVQSQLEEEKAYHEFASSLAEDQLAKQALSRAEKLLDKSIQEMIGIDHRAIIMDSVKALIDKMEQIAAREEAGGAS